MENTNKKLDCAINFDLDFQENAYNMDHEEAIKAAMETNINNIDKSKSEGQIVAFIDNSKAEWIGNAWKIN